MAGSSIALSAVSGLFVLSDKDNMLDYQYSRTEGLLEVIKSRNGDRLCAALLEEESSFSMHVFRYADGRIVMDEGKVYTEEQFADEFEVGYWIIR